MAISLHASDLSGRHFFWNIFHAVYLSWIVRLKSDHFKIRFFYLCACFFFIGKDLP